jgi:hypothetical protein
MWRRLLVLTGLAALVAYVLRRRQAPPLGEPEVDPAEELRRKLDETRAKAEPEPEPETALSDDLAERRRQVHERARAARDEMRGSSPDPPTS